MRVFILVITIVILLSSCSVLPAAKGEDLLEAPMLNQMQKEIYDALKLTLDTSRIQYSHPESGEYRSPFVFRDLDGDEKEEAIVFYSYTDVPEEIFAKILSQEDDGWRPVYDITGKGPSIDFVDFSPLLSKDRISIVIGWNERVKHGQKTISVHSIYDGKLTEELEEPYKAFRILGKNDDLSSIVTIKSSEDIFKLSLIYASGNKLMIMDTAPLYEETTDILQIIESEIPGEGQVIYIDEEMAGVSVSYGTEIIAVGKSLNILVGSEGGTIPVTSTQRWQSYTKTFRKREILSVGHGVNQDVEVPRLKDLVGGTIDTSSKNYIEIIEYMIYKDKEFVSNRIAAVNPDAGYLFYFPERWVDEVTIIKEPQRQEWRFCKISPITGEASTELFRVRIYYAQDYMDEFTKDDIFLGSRGLFSYYGYIPKTYNEPLTVTQKEVEQLFSLIY